MLLTGQPQLLCAGIRNNRKAHLPERAAHYYRLYISLREDKSPSTQPEFRGATHFPSHIDQRVQGVRSQDYYSALQEKGPLRTSHCSKQTRRRHIFHKTFHLGGGGSGGGAGQDGKKEVVRVRRRQTGVCSSDLKRKSG